MKLSIIQPFILGWRKCDDGYKRMVPSWLQYDDGEKTIGKHRRAALEEWSSLDSVDVRLGGVEHTVFLAMADADADGMEQVSIPFGTGTLSGRFPTGSMNVDRLEGLLTSLPPI